MLFPIHPSIPERAGGGSCCCLYEQHGNAYMCIMPRTKALPAHRNFLHFSMHDKKENSLTPGARCYMLQLDTLRSAVIGEVNAGVNAGL